MPLAGNVGMGVVITSYNQNIFISIVATPRLLPDVEKMCDLIGEAFEELWARLAEPAASRSSRSHVVA